MIPTVPPTPPPADPFARYGGHVLRLDELSKYGGYSLPPATPLQLQFPYKMQGLFQPMRYKVLEGGRGSAKSWSAARALIVTSMQRKVRILCARQHQNTIADSVHKLLADQIAAMGLGPWFRVTKTGIRGSNGSEFIFIGLGDLAQANNRTKIKSFESIDICWVEEAESITDETWQVLIPTIRKAGSEIWVVYNPNLEKDATYQRFHRNPPPNAFVVQINWNENPWLSKELLDEKNYLFRVDPEAAEHVWNGKLKQHAEATIFRGKYVVENFDTPEDVRYFHGIDWGFANDPLVMERCYITTVGLEGRPEDRGEHLWINGETWGIGVEINEMVGPTAGARIETSNGPGRLFAFEKLPTYRKWPVKADNARPELISYVKAKGIPIKPADKWKGSVEDGIAHLRGFVKIHIHKDNCPHMAEEASLYRWKVDKANGEILPEPVDMHNHCWDAIRYALDGYIKRRGSGSVWAKCAQN